ncbi:glutathione S-transferase N-terminal domain-containing protein [Fluviispira multicolorata]|uniref:Glutathione transferase GstA n=1 Tax=Fluviispira multicolorata TaxID=2654512 RepID=A0A833JF71_9BACT|nr:glutathione S-transferase N-terminal domain-containing protein [Fluviispira multicolorata]KAB8033571.1 glutathione transferase GstA [Fluviispira multicolorata]
MKLYYAKAASSLGAHIILETLGIQYTASAVDLYKGENRTPEFLKLNALGNVPVLILDDGSILTENSAIFQFLGDYKPELKLIPKGGTQERYKAIEWLGFITSELHKSVNPIWTVDDYVSDAKPRKELKNKFIAILKDKLKVAEMRLDSKDYCLGKSFSVCDAYLLAILNSIHFLKIDISEFKNLVHVYQIIKNNPLVMKVMKLEGLAV